MDVVLLEKVANLGDLGDRVKVKAGYGRNFLLPYGKAVPATAVNIAEFEERRAELEKASADKLTQAKGRASELEEFSLTINANAGDEGKLFGSIGTRDLAETITEAGFAVEKSEVRLPEGALREVGEHEVTLQFHSEVTVVIQVIIAAA